MHWIPHTANPTNNATVMDRLVTAWVVKLKHVLGFIHSISQS